MNMSSSSAAAKKDVQTIIEKNSSSLALGTFSFQLTRFDSIDYLDLTIAKESRRRESALCAISGGKFGKESVLTALVRKKLVALSVGSINVTEITLCTISGKNFSMESVLTALVPKKPGVPSVGSIINVNQRVVKQILVEDKNKISTQKRHEYSNEV